MLRRCLSPSSSAYYHYGARGIRVIRRWIEFTNFIKDMGVRPEGMTLERKDNNGPYSRANCIWASRLEQAQNRRNSKKLRFRGKSMTLRQWSLFLGWSYSGLKQRIAKRGWSVQRALSTPFRARATQWSITP